MVTIDRYDLKSFTAGKAIGAKEVAEDGTTQSKLTTIELGFMPFVPFSRKFNVAIDTEEADLTSAKEGAGGSVITRAETLGKKNIMPSWSLMPREGQKFEPPDWGEKLKNWEREYETWEEAAKKAPYGGMQTESARIAKQLAEQVGKPDLVSEYESGVLAEVREQAVTREIMQKSKVPGLLSSTPAIPVHSESLRTKGLGPGGVKMSRQAADHMAMDMQSGLSLQFTFDTLDQEFGADFTKGALFMETSDMQTQKFFQMNWEDASNFNTNREQAFKDSIADSMHQLEQMIAGLDPMLLSQMYKQLDDQLSEATNYTGDGEFFGGEGLVYTARQFIDRFRRIEMANADVSSANPYNSMVWEMALSTHEIGYLIVRIHVEGRGPEGDAYLTGISHDVGYFDFTNFSNVHEDIHQFLQRHTKATPEGIFRGVPGTPSAIAHHQNFMYWQAMTRHKLSARQIENIFITANREAVDHFAIFGSARGQGIGSIMDTEVQMKTTSLVRNLPQVGVVNILSKQENAKEIQKQVAQILTDPKRLQQIGQWYEQGMQVGDHATKDWQSKVGKGSRATWKGKSLWGNPLYKTAKDLEGIGTPMWVTMGREPFAYKMFQKFGSKKKAEYIKKFGFDPSDRYISKTGDMSVRGWTKERAADELGGWQSRYADSMFEDEFTFEDRLGGEGLIDRILGPMKLRD